MVVELELGFFFVNLNMDLHYSKITIDLKSVFLISQIQNNVSFLVGKLLFLVLREISMCKEVLNSISELIQLYL
jgi:hypothetical protein